MSPVATNQLQFNFDPSLQERFPTKREYIAFLVLTYEKPLKLIAAEMDMSPSTLSRKLNPGDGDCQRFSVDDEEKLFKVCPGIAQKVITYDVSKWCDTPENRQQRVLDDASRLMQELRTILPQLQKVQS